MSAPASGREVVITGIGLVTSLAEGGAANRDAFMAGARPVIDAAATPPYPVHPLVPLDLDKQIPKRGDQRQMEPWQRLGTYAAGLALDDAGIARNPELLARTHMIVAAGGGERDVTVDQDIMSGLRDAPSKGRFLNEKLSGELRPTLFLAQLSNLLAGNISIVHGVTGSSRTFMGEEGAGIDALRTLAARIRAGQAEIGLVGAAYSAPRADMQLVFSFARLLLEGEHAPVWKRRERGGGMVPGSVGAFLVIESREHADMRGARAVARLGKVLSERSRRGDGEARAKADALWQAAGPDVAGKAVGILSGATGAEPVTAAERGFLQGTGLPVRATGTLIGHAVEAAPIANVALAALALGAGAFYPPLDADPLEKPFAGAPEAVVVTNFGPWRSEGLVVVEKA